MNKKIALFTLCGTVVTASAMAATVNWNTSGDKKDLMEAGNIYTGAAISEYMGVTEGTANAKPWYKINAGYYLPTAASTSVSTCQAGKYCSGGSSFQLGSGSTNLGLSGSVSAGYYSSGGAKTATPTSSSDSVVSGAEIGKCISGYDSQAGATTFKQCYATNDSGSCSTFFPGGVSGVNSEHYTGVVFTSNLGPQVPSVNVQNQTTTTRTVSTMISATKAGPFVPTDPGNCVIRGLTCATNYELSNDYTEVGGYQYYIGTGESGYFVSSDSDYNGLYNPPYPYTSNDRIGTFSVSLTGGYQNQGVTVRGIYLKGSHTTGTVTASENGTDCGCRVQNVGVGDVWQPYVSDWIVIENPDRGDCAMACKNYMVDKFSSLAKLQSMKLYKYNCVIESGLVRFNLNGGTGTIQEKTPDSEGTVFATCTATQHIDDIILKSKRNPSKTDKVRLGWSTDENCTDISCVDTTATCASNKDADALYYAVWGTPSCTAGEGINTISYKGISVTNSVECNTTAKADYYVSATSSGGAGVAAATINASKCKDNWHSKAGATTESDCYRSITLNNNDAESGTVDTTTSCNYNTDCTLPSTAGLKKTGYSYTGGWGTTADCTNTSPTVKVASVASNVTYYACRTLNELTINWTGVATGGTGFTQVSGDNYTSKVSYGGDIATPAAGVTKAGMLFIGWKFVKAN